MVLHWCVSVCSIVSMTTTQTQPFAATIKELSIEKDWVEIKVDEQIRRAKRTGFFMDVIDDARHFQADGYAWDCALELSLRYWEA